MLFKKNIHLFQLRRPQRPHDMQLFDPAFRLPPQPPPLLPSNGHNNKPRGVSFRRIDDDIERQYGGGASMRSSVVGKDVLQRHRTSSSTRSSFVSKEKPGEKLVKRVLASEGLGRSALLIYCILQFIEQYISDFLLF
jgi:hypothetical protein